MPHRSLPALALVATIVLWGSAFAAIRAALEHFGFAELGALRLLVAAVALGVVGAVRRIGLPARRDLPAIAAVALAGMTAYQLLLNSGEQTVPAGTASLLVNLSPVFTGLAAVAFLRERMTPLRWTGIGVACAGASLIAVAAQDGLALDAGALLVIGAAAVQAAFFVGQKPLLARYGSLQLTTWAMILGALMALPFAPGLPHAVATAPAEPLLAVAFLGLGASAIGFVTWAYASAHMDVSFAASMLYSVVLVAFATGWLWLGERPEPITLAGGAIALAGVLIVVRSRQPGRSPNPRSISSARSPSVPGRGSTPSATAAP